MNSGFPRFAIPLALAAFAAGNLLVSKGFAQGQAQARRSIEITETNSAEILTNLNLLSTKKDDFRQLDEQLRALKGLATPNSMQQRFEVPYTAPNPVPNRKMMELIQRQKNWNLTAEDLNLSGSADSDTTSFEGTDKLGGKDRSLQQFYDALNRKGSGGKPNDSSNDKAGANKRSILTPESGSEDDPSLPPEVRDRTEQLRNVVSADPNSIFNPARTRSGFQNFFGAGPAASSVTEPHDQKKPEWLNQFQTILDSAVAAGVDPNLSALSSDANSNRKAVTPEVTKLPSATHQETGEQAPAKANTVLDVTAVSDINGTVLNQWNPLYTPPKLQLPKISPPTPPNLDFPRRKF